MEEINLSLTRSSSIASSLTSEDSDHKSDEEKCECVAQPDEKHNQYLNRLEATFITQLHRSTSWLSRWPNRMMNRNLSVNEQDKKTSEQFTVFRDGCREKINFKRATIHDSSDVLKNPWVKHFKHGDKPCSIGSPNANECGKTLHENLLRDLRTSTHKIERYPADRLINETHLSPVGSTSEGSGQNFVYEDCDNDATFRVKKFKISGTDTSSADQIVPSSETGEEIHPLIVKYPAEDQAQSQYSNGVVP